MSMNKLRKALEPKPFTDIDKEIALLQRGVDELTNFIDCHSNTHVEDENKAGKQPPKKYEPYLI